MGDDKRQAGPAVLTERLFVLAELALSGVLARMARLRRPAGTPR